MAENFFTSNKDIQFYVNEYIDWEPILALREKNYENPDGDEDAPKNFEEALDSIKTILDYMGHIVGDSILPSANKVDIEGGATYDPKTKTVTLHPETEKNLNILIESGIMGFGFPRKYGGLNCTQLTGNIANEILSLGDAGLMTTVTLQWGVGNIILHFADEELIKECIPKLSSGEYGAAMVLTEPDAGSDLGRILTTAKYDEDKKHWLINGSKRFITNGHRECHLVLARSEPDSMGDVRGISLFYVNGNDVEVSRIEHKMGIHGSATCELIYDNSPGILIGKRRFGLVKYMYALMNEARLAVATQGLGMAQAAYNEALKYSDEREQFGKKIREFPPVARLLVEMKMDIESLRALIYQTSWYVDMYFLLEGRLNEIKKELKEASGDDKDKLKAERDKLTADYKKYRMYADVLTPLSKMKSGQLCIRVTSDALQVLGGVGYTKEFNVERFFRDARIVDVYEGTGQLQAKAAISGVLNRILQPLMDEYVEKAKKSDDPLVKISLEKLIQANKFMDESIDRIKSLSDQENYEDYLHLYEGRLCQMLHDIFAGYILLDQALILERKKYVVKRYSTEMLGRIKMWKEQILEGELSTIENFDVLTEAEF